MPDCPHANWRAVRVRTGNAIEYRGAEALAGVLTQVPKLHTLGLSGALSRSMLASIDGPCADLAACVGTGAARVTLAGNAIGDGGAAALADVLGLVPQVRELELAGTYASACSTVARGVRAGFGASCTPVLCAATS